MIAKHLLVVANRQISTALLLATIFSISGCAWFVEQSQGSISAKSNKQVELITVTANESWGNVIACIKNQGGMCGAKGEASIASVASLRPVLSKAAAGNTAASYPAKALIDPTAQSFEDIMNYASGRSTQGQSTTSISRTAAQAFAKNLFDATNTGGWMQLVKSLTEDRNELTDKTDPNGSRRAQIAKAIDYAKQVGSYLSAYFDNGHFVSLTVNPSQLESSVTSELESKLGLSADAAKATVGDVIKQTIGQSVGADGYYHLITAKNDGGFVTRGGDKYSFPTISVTITPGTKESVSTTKVDFSQIACDLIRVYIEAVGDLWGKLPGTQQSTGVKSGLLREYAKDPSKPEQVNETHFMQVNSESSSAETAAATATGQLIRGIGWVSLNNEALAKLIETAAGVVVRKATEKVGWCIAACQGANVDDFNGGNTDVSISNTRVLVVE